MVHLLGKPIKEEILLNLHQRIELGQKIRGYIIYNPASFEASSYHRLIAKLLVSLNLEVVEAEIQTAAEAEKAIKEANSDPVGSLFLCRPLLIKEEKELIEEISPVEDADMLTAVNLGKLAKGDLDYLSGTSCSVKKIIDYYKIPVEGKKVLVVGRSVSVGLPAALMLLKKNAELSIAHSKVPLEEIRKKAKEAEILVLASGQRLLRPEDINQEGTVIDCGYLEDGKGDLGFEPDCKMFTPVPGGVGPVTIACLAENAFNLRYGKGTK
jgi:methylenetetrahydrofolate dehydrogenase (NADP+)/methenyltetrahydrofolate cyclohydrolase